jgi:hypothetical protein
MKKTLEVAIVAFLVCVSADMAIKKHRQLPPLCLNK